MEFWEYKERPLPSYTSKLEPKRPTQRLGFPIVLAPIIVHE